MKIEITFFKLFGKKTFYYLKKQINQNLVLPIFKPYVDKKKLTKFLIKKNPPIFKTYVDKNGEKTSPPPLKILAGRLWHVMHRKLLLRDAMILLAAVAIAGAYSAGEGFNEGMYRR